MTQGIVALDIDGTVLSRNQNPSPSLITTLSLLEKEGWKILFATGRTVAWSLHHLKNLPFPFYLAAFNGAALLSYPEGKKIHVATLLKKDILGLSLYVDRFGVVAYELEGEERVFVARQPCSPFIQEHLKRRKALQKESWVEFGSAQELPQVEFGSLRFFLQKGEESFLQSAIEGSSELSAFIMKDSFHEDVRIVQVTAKGVSKGSALKYLCKKFSPVLGTIAAGDDSNDVNLLEMADIGIAVGDAPQELRKIAYSTASSPDVLHQALERAKNVLVERAR